MKTSIRIHQNAFKSTRVKFTENEQKTLDSYSVKTATLAAEQAWKSVKKDTLSFAKKLQRVHRVMVKGNSPKSLFSKWLKSVGIPRATAYWTLKRSGVSNGKKPLSVTKLIQKREKLEVKLSKAEKDDKAQIKDQIDRVKNQLTRRREVLQNRLNSIAADLKEVMNAISVFNGTTEAKNFPTYLSTWMEKNDRLLSKMTIAQQREYLQVFTNAIADETGLPSLPALKKPVASVRTVEHRPIATA